MSPAPPFVHTCVVQILLILSYLLLLSFPRRCVTKKHETLFHSVKDLHVLGHNNPREWLQTLHRKWTGIDNETVICVYSSIGEHDRFPNNDEIVRVEGSTMVKYDKLPPVDDIPQTRVTLMVLNKHSAAHLPKWGLQMAVQADMLMLSRMRLTFDKSFAIDEANRETFIDKITTKAHLWIDEDEETLVQSKTILDVFDKPSKVSGLFTPFSEALSDHAFAVARAPIVIPFVRAASPLCSHRVCGLAHSRPSPRRRTESRRPRPCRRRF